MHRKNKYSHYPYKQAVYIAEMPFLVKWHHNEFVKSLVDPTIIPLVRARGGKPTKNKQKNEHVAKI